MFLAQPGQLPNLEILLSFSNQEDLVLPDDTANQLTNSFSTSPDSTGGPHRSTAPIDRSPSPTPSVREPELNSEHADSHSQAAPANQHRLTSLTEDEADADSLFETDDWNPDAAAAFTIPSPADGDPYQTDPPTTGDSYSPEPDPGTPHPPSEDTLDQPLTMTGNSAPNGGGTELETQTTTSDSTAKSSGG